MPEKFTPELATLEVGAGQSIENVLEQAIPMTLLNNVHVFSKHIPSGDYDIFLSKGSGVTLSDVISLIYEKEDEYYRSLGVENENKQIREIIKKDPGGEIPEDVWERFNIAIKKANKKFTINIKI